MLFDWLTATGPILAGLTCAIAATVLIGYLLLRRISVLDQRVALVVKAAYQNTREINQNTREINGFANGIHRLATQTEASTEFHRKAHDQQRVLLASLNKQMRHLETLLGHSAPPRQISAKPPLSVRRKPQPAIQDGNATGFRKDRVEATPFSELLARAQAPANGHLPEHAETDRAAEADRSNPRQAVLLSKLFEQRGSLTGEGRANSMAAPAAAGNASQFMRKVING